MKNLHIAIAGVSLLAAPVAARPFTAHDMVMLSRITAPSVSSNERWLVWQQQEIDFAGNKERSDLWRLDLTRRGAKPERLAAEADVNEQAPQFARDDRHVYFKSDKGGADAVWEIGVDGSNAHRLTSFQGGFTGFKVAPNGDRLLIWADRKTGASNLSPTTRSKGPEEARVYEKLLVRDWDHWVDDNRSQLFVLAMNAEGSPGDGIAIQRGLDGDGEQAAWSADGRTIYFALKSATTSAMQPDNLDVWSAPADGSAAPTDLSVSNLAADSSPAPSPDGRYLAYAAAKRPNVESDRMVVMLRELATGKVRALTERWDRSVTSLTWSPDSERLIVTADDERNTPAFSVDIRSGLVTPLTGKGHVTSVLPTSKGVVYARDTLTEPGDFWRLKGNRQERLTTVNAAKLAGIDMPTVDWFAFSGAHNDTVSGYAVRPAWGGRKVPFLLSVHGGPTGSNNDRWSYRPNAAVIAGAGYGVVSIDYHGSTGHGQAFADLASGTETNLPLDDLRAGLAAATSHFTWLDTNRVCALGHSYGGYLMSLMEGQWAGRFKCMIQSHGVFDTRTLAYDGDQPGFDSAKPYWQDPAAYEKWNPVNYAANWTTPMLVLSGDRDFRVPETQAIATFTALQVKGIPSRLVISTSDHHFITKPKNLELWNTEILNWMGRWLK